MARICKSNRKSASGKCFVGLLEFVDLGDAVAFCIEVCGASKGGPKCYIINLSLKVISYIFSTYNELKGM